MCLPSPNCLPGHDLKAASAATGRKSARAEAAPRLGAWAQDTPVRYDGIYRIVRCWRKPGAQGFLMCRYLFVRCDNEPAPWSSEGARGGSNAGFVVVRN